MGYTTENIILKKLSGKNSGEEASVAELMAITNKYPAFGAGKYLLAKKMQAQQHADFEKQAQGAVLYFPNPFWFHFKLNEERLMNNPAFLSKKELPKESASPETTEFVDKPKEHTLPLEEIGKPVAEITAEQPAEEVVEAAFLPAIESIDAQQPVEDNALPTTVEEVQVVENIEAPGNDLSITPVGLTPVSVAEEGEEAAHTEEAIAEGNVEQQPETTEPSVKQFKETGGLEESSRVILDEEAVAPEITKADFSEAVQQDEHPVEEEITPIISPTDGQAKIAAPVDEEVVDHHSMPAEKGIVKEVSEDNEGTDGEDETSMPALNSDKLTAILDEQFAEFKKPVAEETPVPIETEPYHTVDYFASQGIKLSRELQVQDHLSVKVKKFTDWLKQMKRIHPQPADLGIDEATESRVQNIAAGSNELKEVVTEAMAEVLAKQGMHEKAIQVYTKLSFLYPDKSAYFASQIEHLKEK